MATPFEQLEAMRRLPENWDGYGGAAPKANVIDLAQEFAGLLDAMLTKAVTERPALQISPTLVGGVLIEWEDQAAQHEIELNPDCSISFLHLQKATGQTQTRQFSPRSQAVVDPGLLHELHQSDGRPLSATIIGLGHPTERHLASPKVLFGL